jgi:hypothetical protein
MFDQTSNLFWIFGTVVLTLMAISKVRNHEQVIGYSCFVAIGLAQLAAIFFGKEHFAMGLGYSGAALVLILILSDRRHKRNKNAILNRP